MLGHPLLPAQWTGSSDSFKGRGHLGFQRSFGADLHNSKILFCSEGRGGSKGDCTPVKVAFHYPQPKVLNGALQLPGACLNELRKHWLNICFADKVLITNGFLSKVLPSFSNTQLAPQKAPKVFLPEAAQVVLLPFTWTPPTGTPQPLWDSVLSSLATSPHSIQLLLSFSSRARLPPSTDPVLTGG